MDLLPAVAKEFKANLNDPTPIFLGHEFLGSGMIWNVDVFSLSFKW